MIRTISFVCAVAVLATIAIFAAVPQSAPGATQADKSTEAAGLNNLGVAYMNQQLFEKALKMFEDAAALDPNFRMAPMNEGIALLNLGRVDAARKFLDQAVKQNPNDPHAWYNLGMLEKNSANSQAAVEALKAPLNALEESLKGKEYLLGKNFTIADLNVAAVMSWAAMIKLDLSSWPNVSAWLQKCLGREANKKVRGLK